MLVEGPGPIGSLTAHVADSMGARVLVSGLERDEVTRFPILEDQGIETVNVEMEDLTDYRKAFTDGIGFDVVFDTTGHQSGVEMAAEVVRKGGQIVVVGLPGEESGLFMTSLVRGEVDLNTAYGSNWKNFKQALRLMENGVLKPDEFIDNSFDVSDPTAAFQAFLNSETLKPVFTFDSR